MQKNSIVIFTKFAKNTRKQVEWASLADQSITINKSPDALELTHAAGIAFIFPDGIIVDWSVDGIITSSIAKHKNTVFANMLSHSYTESLQFTYTAPTEKFALTNDILHIPSKEATVLLAISYALAQAIQLDYKENKIESILRTTHELPLKLAQTGTVSLSGRNIKKKIGLILQMQYETSLSGLIEDRPNLFWEEPELAGYYNKTAVYLELQERSVIVDQKLLVIQNTMEFLRDEVNTRHSSWMEMIIIFLILFEIMFFFFESYIAPLFQ